MNNDVIIKADNLYFSYDDEKSHSLNGLSLEIRRGRKIAFMGANGSGKSTFFLCCNGIHQPSSGTLYVDGEPVDYSREGLLKLRQKIGIVFQDPDNQLFSASVYQEISFGVLNLGKSEEEARQEVERVIDEMEITPFRDKPTHALSGGQKKQVSIADILVMHPEVIILDEPAAALDPRHTVMVNEAVDRMTAQGITVMMATHDVNYAFEWADEIMLFKDGQVLMHGAPVEVFSNLTALAQTNLEQPVVLQLFDSLCKKGILKPSLPVPVTLSQLEKYIEEVPVSASVTTGRVFEETRRAILVVSFGTSYEETRKVTIDAIEQEIGDAHPDYKIYRAWTSKMILKKLKKRDNIHYDTVTEAFQRMREDGITDVVVQPTHVINGIENDLMTQEALAFRNDFHSILFGDPLLTTMEDNDYMIEAIREEFSGSGRRRGAGADGPRNHPLFQRHLCRAGLHVQGPGLSQHFPGNRGSLSQHGIPAPHDQGIPAPPRRPGALHDRGRRPRAERYGRRRPGILALPAGSRRLPRHLRAEGPGRIRKRPEAVPAACGCGDKEEK